MADVKDWATQADRMLGSRYLQLTSRHAAKQAAGVKGNQATGKIHSFASLHKHTQVLKNAGEWIHQTFGVTRLDKITTEQAQAYLQHRQDTGIGQKQLDSDRLGLKLLKGVEAANLERAIAIEPRKLDSRAYTEDQATRIAERQTERNALATDIAHQAGLRAHEMFTLQRADEAAPSQHRQWTSERFQGRQGERYIVTGKGGLVREVLLPHGLAERLEARRLDQPKTVIDRKIRYETTYDIGGGQAWSQSVSQNAKKEFGWSNGGHGLRHKYVQQRMTELQKLGHRYQEAKSILTQEVGHFREDVINTYLR